MTTTMSFDINVLDDLQIVDAHHHFCDLDAPVNYPWVIKPTTSRHGDYSSICRSYPPEEYKRDTALRNLIGSVHVEAECDRDHQLDYEGELAIVIGKPGRYISRADALQHVLGYTCFNDGSVRDFQFGTAYR